MFRRRCGGEKEARRESEKRVKVFRRRHLDAS